jgi:hypothetical protein
LGALQEKHERAVGDAFIDWYNKQMGTSFAYSAHGAEAPDLIYRDGTKELLLEITVAHYAAGHATMLWQNARDLSDAPDSWSSKGPDQKLIDSVTLALAKKSAKAYPSGCVLPVVVYPDLTDAEEFTLLIPESRSTGPGRALLAPAGERQRSHSEKADVEGPERPTGK